MKIIISHDILFDEKATWSWNQNDVKENIPLNFDDDKKVQQPMEDEHHEEATLNIPIDDKSPFVAESQRPHCVHIVTLLLLKWLSKN